MEHCKFLILFIFTFEISRHSLEKSEKKGKKRQNKAIKLFKTDDVLLMYMSARVHVFVISANPVIANDLDYLVKGCYSVVTG